MHLIIAFRRPSQTVAHYGASAGDNKMIMLVLLVPAGLLGMLVCMDRLERWAVETQDEG
jgi:hypothetical protein